MTDVRPVAGEPLAVRRAVGGRPAVPTASSVPAPAVPVLAAIDVGSNGIRLVVARLLPDRRLDVLRSTRAPVRLGADVFTTGALTDETIERTVEAFVGFRRALDELGVTHVRAVGTSALRDAKQRDLVLDRIAQETGIEIEVVSAEEEARLVRVAVADRIDLVGQVALLIDVGGGSVEVTVTRGPTILATESFRMGTVRLLTLLDRGRQGGERFNRLVREYAAAAGRRLREELGDARVDVCVGTGGNVEALAELAASALGAPAADRLGYDDLKRLRTLLEGLSPAERVERLRLRPDRADVIAPAAIVLHRMMKQTGVREMRVPGVGVKDGVLRDLAEAIRDPTHTFDHAQAMASARQLGRKYAFDEPHAEIVARLATRLFDETRALHHLGEEERELLEVAAWVHDVGTFVDARSHHKHSYYLLMAREMVGLTRPQRAIVANVARYHRKSLPSLAHEGYRDLSPRDRVVVSKLAALLRVADALDVEKASRVRDVEVLVRKPRVTLRLVGEGDLLLERWAVREKARLFEEVYGAEVVLDEPTAIAGA